jgi:hypothetical protein
VLIVEILSIRHQSQKKLEVKEGKFLPIIPFEEQYHRMRGIILLMSL